MANKSQAAAVLLALLTCVGCNAVADGSFPSRDDLAARLNKGGYQLVPSAPGAENPRSEVVEWRSVRVFRYAPAGQAGGSFIDLLCVPADITQVAGLQSHFASTDRSASDGLSRSYAFNRELVKNLTRIDFRELPRSEFGIPPLFGLAGHNDRATAMTKRFQIDCKFYERAEYMSWAEVQVLQTKW